MIGVGNSIWLKVLNILYILNKEVNFNRPGVKHIYNLLSPVKYDVLCFRYWLSSIELDSNFQLPKFYKQLYRYT